MPDWNSFLSGAENGISSVTNTIQQQTSNLSNAAGTAEQVLDNIGLGATFSSTIGSVLANGFNLSCWGSSLTPQLATDRINKTYRPYFIYLVNKMLSAASSADKMAALNELLKQVYVISYYYGEKKMTEAGWTSCAQKAINEVYKPFFAKFKMQVDEILSDFLNQGGSKKDVTMKPITYFIPKETTGDTKDYIFKYDSQTSVTKEWNVTYPVLTSAPPAPVVTNPENTQVLQPEHTTNFGPKFPTESEHEDVVPPNKPKGDDEKKGPSGLQIALGLWGLTRLF